MSDKIAVIKTGGKQYKVKEGQTVKIEKLDKNDGEKVSFDALLIASADGKEVELGKPLLDKKVGGQVVSSGKSKKVLVVKYKNKTRYTRTRGHRQLFTKVKIDPIV